MELSQSLNPSNEILLKNYSLDSFDPLVLLENQEIKRKCLVSQVQEHLEHCGEVVKRNWYCKHCESERNPEALLRVDKAIRLDCQMRYCSNPQCVNTRFARILEVLKSVSRIKDLRRMFHFSIGFPKIDIQDFKKEVKEQRRNINSYFAKLRKKGVFINGFQVLDISRGVVIKEWDGKYYVHYHIVAIPFRNSEVRKNMILMKQVEKEMKLKQKTKCPFFVKIYGIKNKEALLSYISIRAVGLYKSQESKEKFYSREAKRLTESIEKNKFMFLNQIVDIKTYVSSFYNRRMFSILGKEIKLPKGSIILDNIVPKYPCECLKHGHLTRKDVRCEIVRPNKPEPPPEVLNIEIVKVFPLTGVS